MKYLTFILLYSFTLELFHSRILQAVRPSTTLRAPPDFNDLLLMPENVKLISNYRKRMKANG